MRARRAFVAALFAVLATGVWAENRFTLHSDLQRDYRDFRETICAPQYQAVLAAFDIPSWSWAETDPALVVPPKRPGKATSDRAPAIVGGRIGAHPVLRTPAPRMDPWIAPVLAYDPVVWAVERLLDAPSEARAPIVAQAAVRFADQALRRVAFANADALTLGIVPLRSNVAQQRAVHDLSSCLAQNTDHQDTACVLEVSDTVMAISTEIRQTVPAPSKEAIARRSVDAFKGVACAVAQ